jgi:hypothetical protein
VLNDAEQSGVLGVLSANLKTLRTYLHADMETLLAPSADPKGNILHQGDLIAASDRVTYAFRHLLDIANSLETYPRSVNDALVELRAAANGMLSAVETVHTVANRMPATIEDFYMPLGPTIPKLRIATKSLLALIDNIIRYLPS